MAQNQYDPSLPAVPELLSLEEGRFEEAEECIGKWLKACNRQKAEEAFIQAYGKTWARMTYEGILPACNPKPGRFADHELMVRTRADELSVLLKEAKATLKEPQRRVLELCLNSSQALVSKDFPEVFQSIDDKLIQATAETATWSPDEEYWLTYLALKTHLASPEAKNKSAPPHLANIQKLLFEVVHNLPMAEAEAAYREFIVLCSNPGAGAWCMKMIANTADARLDSYRIPLELAYSSCTLNRDYAHLALQLLERAEKNLDRVGIEREQQEKAWIAYTRGLSYQQLADLGEDGTLDNAIRSFEGAISEAGLAEGGPGSDRIYGAIAGALIRKGETEKAGVIIEQGLQKTIGSEQNQLRAEKYRLLLFLGEFEKAVEFTKKGSSNKSILFQRCLSKLFARNQTDTKSLKKDVADFLSTSEDYTDYIRLIFYWKLMRDGNPDEAKKLLDERWQQIKPTAWADLLQADRGAGMRVWREKLIGYYLGKVGEAEVCDVVQDPERFLASPYHNAEQSREGFLCEWYFYDGLLQSVNDDPTTRRNRLSERLTKVVATEQSAFLEYMIAREMLKRINEGEVYTLEEVKQPPAYRLSQPGR